MVVFSVDCWAKVWDVRQKEISMRRYLEKTGCGMHPFTQPLLVDARIMHNFAFHGITHSKDFKRKDRLLVLVYGFSSKNNSNYYENNMPVKPPGGYTSYNGLYRNGPSQRCIFLGVYQRVGMSCIGVQKW